MSNNCPVAYIKSDGYQETISKQSNTFLNTVTQGLKQKFDTLYTYVRDNFICNDF